MAETTTREQLTQRLADGHRVVPVLRELFADAETPVGIYRKLADGRPGTFLLESAEQGGIWSRWSFVGVSSFGVLTEVDGATVWSDTGIDATRALGDAASAPPLEALAALYQRWSTPRVDGHPPLTGGLVGYIGWDAIRQIEHLPSPPPADFAVPSQALAFVSELVVLDHRFGTVTLIAAVLGDQLGDQPEVAHDADAVTALWDDAQARLDRLEAALGAPTTPDVASIDLGIEPTIVANGTPDDYMASVVRSKDFIRDGDVFQVVLSQRFDHESTAYPLDVYRVLRALNPSPYMYLLALETPDARPLTIVGSSPEALVKVTGGRATMHPIAGSRPRGTTPEADVALADELLADPKERAEHLMLVDLARNDLLKVCRAGTVAVTEFMAVERFSHIMHLVSTVEGEVLDAATPVDVFRATFPAGTLSGAPKPRALEIIDELEPAARGVYGGVVGYLDFAGDADLAIAIRTATILDGVAHVQAGAGLVADSDPATELAETVNKAAAPLRAVAIANALRRR